MILLGYVGKDSPVTELDAKRLTHIHAAFGYLGCDGSIDLQGHKITEKMAQIREWNPEIKILLSLVPGEPPAFTRCAASSTLRKAVGASAAALVNSLGFDGVDFDWEYPCVPSNNVDTGPRDKRNFTLLCREVRETMDSLCPGKSPLLSIAAGADLYYVESVELPALAQILDYVCLMTYDLKCGFHALSGHHTALYSSTGDYFRNSCDQAMRLFAAAGMPKEKLLLGAAFYSRKWENVPDKNNGMLQLTPAGGGYGPGYGELAADYVNKRGFTRYWDEEAKAPWLFDGSTFYSYDDETSVALKARYVAESGWGGIFYWEHACDRTGMLLKIIAENLG